MNHRIPPVLLLAALACPLGTAHAERADRGKPMNIEADTLRHDELKQTSAFSGHVVMSKGSILLRGARLELRQDTDGYQHGVLTAEAGKRAFFRQKRDTAAGVPDEFVEGESEVIEYDGKADRMRFVSRAELRRYRGAQLSDEITGAVIVYNNLTDVLTVDGERASSSGAGGAPTGRARAVLAPKAPPKDDAAPPAAAAPTLPAPVLRPSNRLGGDK
ncbi:lipopolysaccharide transport periplasmic protein LptA [Verminephrobacter aporrectodeae]|uniref:lipopolysaccharide transport periplasmic protein LptA n=1 Tax=Verminephrobacter aporrectodeae TaxID=1110389 RepID=UPI002238E2A7|nr:lipopolysaccharide transport periplasmic protein LptA [Verminephrobacter aporrectodeae]MCW5222765.1 lipopolysaccharide transport periplasmic protein LptA [Verminephrobacter aporrectodeae subsp. tuberculatae]MCW5257007.1 lipopolysaccharide transport periplasmic protein LptA [Verminephrobacter aporrectodeae subsp. tuberculatae]MCW5288229.1 lipopolysaccharide transport periplasmic protein LptA [Verminephrobacter aporrectodeae subsp. tuberculatae]MCW8163361.1 lipopolysaccharide transport peripla